MSASCSLELAMLSVHIFSQREWFIATFLVNFCEKYSNGNDRDNLVKLHRKRVDSINYFQKL